jgi:predicted HicB family RNase H-like nuclease
MSKLETEMKVEKGEVKLTLRLPLELARDLKHKAIDENTSVNALLMEAARGLLKRK